MLDLVAFCPKCGSALPWMGAGHCEACQWSEDDLNAVQVEEKAPAVPARPDMYTFTAGDSFPQVLDRFGISEYEIYRLNPWLEKVHGPLVGYRVRLAPFQGGGELAKLFYTARCCFPNCERPACFSCIDCGYRSCSYHVKDGQGGAWNHPCNRMPLYAPYFKHTPIEGCICGVEGLGFKRAPMIYEGEIE